MRLLPRAASSDTSGRSLASHSPYRFPGFYGWNKSSTSTRIATLSYKKDNALCMETSAQYALQLLSVLLHDSLRLLVLGLVLQ